MISSVRASKDGTQVVNSKGAAVTTTGGVVDEPALFDTLAESYHTSSEFTTTVRQRVLKGVTISASATVDR